MNVELYTDGSALRNPGPGGLGYVIRYWIDNGNDMPEEKSIDGNQGFRLTTNNRMELMAGIYGIDAIIDNVNAGIIQKPNQVNIFSDSEYFCKAITMRWLDKWQQNNWMTSGYNGAASKPVKNKDLWERIVECQNQLRNMGINIVMTHVKGHSGNDYNEKADKLAYAASNSLTHIPDEEYEKSTTIINNNGR